MKASFRDSEYLDRIEKASFDPVFLMGFHRSGTTLLYHILDATGAFSSLTAYHIVQYDELLANFFEGNQPSAKQAFNERLASEGLTDRKVDAHRVHADFTEEYCFLLENRTGRRRLDKKSLALFQEMCRKVRVISETDKPLLLKSPWDFDNFLFLKSAFPRARFVFIHRHPFSVIHSQIVAIRALLAEKNGYVAMIHTRYAEALKNPLLLRAGRFVYSPRFPILVNRVIGTILRGGRYYLDNLSTLAPEDYIAIRYEDICSAPRENIQAILSFLGLQAEADVPYEELIKERETRLLKEIEKRRHRIYGRTEDYCKQFRFAVND